MTKVGITNAIGKLSANFTKLDNSFFSVLAERAKHNGFDDEGLIRAVNSVIDNFIYQEPKIADILKINSNVQLFTYHEIVEKNDSMDRKAFEYYRPIEVKGISKAMYASVIDIEKYNLTLFKIKEL